MWFEPHPEFRVQYRLTTCTCALPFVVGRVSPATALRGGLCPAGRGGCVTWEVISCRELGSAARSSAAVATPLSAQQVLMGIKVFRRCTASDGGNYMRSMHHCTTPTVADGASLIYRSPHQRWTLQVFAAATAGWHPSAQHPTLLRQMHSHNSSTHIPSTHTWLLRSCATQCEVSLPIPRLPSCKCNSSSLSPVRMLDLTSQPSLLLMYGTSRRFAWLLAISAGLCCCSGADQPDCLPLGTPCAYKPGYGTELCCQLPPPDDVICSCNKVPLGTCKLQENVCCVSEGKCGCVVDTDCCGLSACNKGCCETGSKGAGDNVQDNTSSCLELGKGPCQYKPGYGTDLCCQPPPPDDRICGCTRTALGKCKASETVCCTSGGRCGCSSDEDCCGLSDCRDGCCT